MKPLNPFNYLKRNPKKMLPVFSSVAIGVLLVYTFSLFGATTSKMINVAAFDLTSQYNIVYTKDHTALPQDFLDELNYYGIEEVCPVQMNISGLAYYRGGMGSTTLTTFNLFSDDTMQVLDSFGIKLVEGSLPQNNQDEILVPIEYALQNGLSVGEYIGSAVSDEYSLQGKYKICGLIKGEVLFSITCQPENERREQVMSKGIMYNIEDLSSAEQESLIEGLPSNVIAITNTYYQQQLSVTLDSMKALTYILTAVIVIVLCISLGNLNVIMFDSRRNEIMILQSIGFTKRELAGKVWAENLLICLCGYFVGVLTTTAVIWVMNMVFLVPGGKVLEVVSIEGLSVALILTGLVSVFSVLPGGGKSCANEGRPWCAG